MVRGDLSKRKIALVFTGDTFAEGGELIANTLKAKNVDASFFFTGNFYQNQKFAPLIKRLKSDGHYLGPHSDKHLLYCSWTNRDSLLVSEDQFTKDLLANYSAMEKFGIKKKDARYFIPPYEWYNDSISKWTMQLGIQLINFSPGTRSTSDYTTPDMKNYRSSDEIMQSIKAKDNDLNGFILLLHIGTDPARTDKFYRRLDELIEFLRSGKYEIVRVDELLD
ncbi:MAG TPA: polysaccharide deacetylase family protein [Chryseolinea sp.]|nr:polysaccharide deacetylase family protein [Chryseolinea sp.]